ncbi:MAG: hypothetical protein EOP48_30985 [Sphingobacteriales bacterium]|nr:MAG: hypothetical protein EOP48_30985 [Sphingobacteriales bacterium]
MKLPRASDGGALFCVTSSGNASKGIPIAITGSIIDDLKLKEGDLLNINNSKWTRYTQEWSRSFPTTKGIPRGFLQIDSHKMISVIRSGHSVISHPFSIMEYETENNFLYDFVFCSALSNVGRNVRSDLESFFEHYRKDKDRNGRYLINTDLVDPLFDAYYFAPSEMNNPLEKAKLDLLYKRVSNVPIAGITLHQLLERLPMFYNTPQAIQTLATKLGIARSHLVEGNAASMSSYLINYCIDREKIDRLIKYVSIDYKEFFER